MATTPLCKDAAGEIYYVSVIEADPRARDRPHQSYIRQLNIHAGLHEGLGAPFAAARIGDLVLVHKASAGSKGGRPFLVRQAEFASRYQRL